MQLIPSLGHLKKNCVRAWGSGLSIIYRAQLAWRTIVVPENQIALCYGPGIGEELRRGDQLTGGKVKLSYLHHRYPHDGRCFNILYLVSSALPNQAVEVIRWARKRGAKIVLNQNGVAYPAWTRDYQEINSELLSILGSTDLVIYQSEFCKRGADRFLREAPSFWQILPNCVDVARFEPIKRMGNGVCHLLVAGTHHHRERVTLPLHAVRMLIARKVKVQLTVAGRLAWPCAESEIQALICQLGLESCVTLSGPFTQEQAPLLYARHDILLHLKYKDPCPNVVIEAMASGLPVIGSDSGGMPELIGKEGGVLLPVDDNWDEMLYPKTEDLSDAIIEVGRSLHQWRASARMRACKRFSSNDWVDSHTKMLSALVAA